MEIMLDDYWYQRIEPLLKPIALRVCVFYRNNFHNQEFTWWIGEKCALCQKELSVGPGSSIRFYSCCGAVTHCEVYEGESLNKHDKCPICNHSSLLERNANSFSHEIQQTVHNLSGQEIIDLL